MGGERTARARAGVDEAFRAGALHLEAPPTRFYLNLTERCSLRCRHCITRAPERTAAGAARDLGPEVVAALAPHLAHAAYVGFPHAGEPLLAPALEPVLEALRSARGGEPTVVHLLTNGLALTEERFADLCARGVNSWSISLDGMSAASHDALRLGSRVEALLARLRALAALRGGARLGVAWTLTRSNLAELPALVDFAAEAGLDWVKLEEVFPLNPAAQAEADLSPERLRAALAEVRGRALARGLRLLEHVFPTPAWKCRPAPDPEAARFGALDDFVNRMEINPCRLPYELVCVEPDGELKALSFHAPPAGHLLRGGLPAAWNGPRFLEERARARAQRRCGSGPATCGADPGPEKW